MDSTHGGFRLKYQPSDGLQLSVGYLVLGAYYEAFERGVGIHESQQDLSFFEVPAFEVLLFLVGEIDFHIEDHQLLFYEDDREWMNQAIDDERIPTGFGIGMSSSGGATLGYIDDCSYVLAVP